MSKGVKRKCTFNSKLQADYPFLKKFMEKMTESNVHTAYLSFLFPMVAAQT